LVEGKISFAGLAAGRGAPVKSLPFIVAVLFTIVSQAAPDPTEPRLSFFGAIEEIIKRSIAVGQQQNTLEKVRSSTLKDQLSLLPTLSGKAVQTKNQYFGQAEDYTRELSVELDLNLFHFGADLAAMRAAGAEIEAEKLRVLQSVLTAEQSAVSALVGVIQDVKTLEVLRHIAEIRSELLAIAEERYTRGLLARQEVDKVLVDKDNAESRMKDSQIQLFQDRATLVSLLGHDRVDVGWPWVDRYTKTGNEAPARRAPDLSKRPDWKAASEAAEAADHRIKQNWGQMLPSLDLTLTAGHVEDFQYQESGREWSGMISLTVPLFDRLANYGTYREQVYTKANADLDLEQVKRTARSEWDAYDQSLRTAIESVRVRDSTVRTSEKLYQDNLQRFQQGRVSANDLVLDQNRLYDSELLAIQGWAAVHLTFSQWCHAQGLRVTQCD
jgi:outer membrane protein TolC